MNVIYLTENLTYAEATPDEFGTVVIPEKNLITGFVDRGMLYAMKDEENEVLKPFEIFVQFNDLSVEFIQPNHFSQENRVFSIANKQFCELKQVFNCAVLNFTEMNLQNYIADSLKLDRSVPLYSLLVDLTVNDVSENPNIRLTTAENQQIDFQSSKKYVLAVSEYYPIQLAFLKNGNPKASSTVAPLKQVDNSLALKFAHFSYDGLASDIQSEILTLDQYREFLSKNDVEIKHFPLSDFPAVELPKFTVYQGDKTGKQEYRVYFYEDRQFSRTAPEYDQYNDLYYEFEGVLYADYTDIWMTPNTVNTFEVTIFGQTKTFEITANPDFTGYDMIFDTEEELGY